MPDQELKSDLILGYETEIRHLVNDLRLTTEEYETSRRNYFEIYSKLFQANEQLQVEIRERKQAREELAVRLRYETGIANFSQALLLTKENTIDNALPFLLEASQVSRVYIFENFMDSSGKLCARKTHEVCARGVKCLGGKEVNFQHLPYEQGLRNWAKDLSRRKPVIGVVDDFSQDDQILLRTQSIISILIIPIFINEKWHGLIGFDDIHEKRQWNDADIRMLETAGEIVGAFLERTLAEEKLRYAKKLAEEASRLKSQLVFNVSHEIRTPLNCIIGFAENIQYSNSIPEIQQNAKSVLQQSELLLILIGDLLDHAKIEAGKMLIEQRPFDLIKVLERMSDSLGSLTKAKGIEFIIDSDDEKIPRYLLGDELRLLQVLMNLGGNSVKFTEQGSIRVRIEKTETNNSDADITLLFSIIDTGIGIAKDKQQDIFNSFTQADGSITRKYGGTGLGTTIARQLVELMGGKCGLESEPGKGSRFWFTTPFKIADDAQIAQLQLTADRTGFENVPSKTGRILVAEDYLPNMQVVLQHLANTGYTVDAVQNGVQAVEACKQKEYDLILLDVQMPEMDGYQAARAIRSGVTRCTQKPVIAITAHADSTSRQNCIKSGMNDILIKPIRRDTFLPFIDSWITGKRKILDTDKTLERNKNILKEFLAPIDYKKAIYEFGGNKQALDDVLKQFLDSLDVQINVLNAAQKNQDSELLRTEAHRIRGGAANLTAVRLAACAEKLENCVIQGQLDKAERFLLDFESEVKKLKHFIATEKIIL